MLGWVSEYSGGATGRRISGYKFYGAKYFLQIRILDYNPKDPIVSPLNFNQKKGAR
jgi:hypothetical protein